MIKISYAKYTLQPIKSPNAASTPLPRQGALLAVEWPDGRRGFTDLHPWPEFGDADLDEELLNISQGRLSPLAEQAIWLANRDAKARSQERSLFEGKPVLRNNFLVSDLLSFAIDLDRVETLKSRGFEILKIKVGRNLEEEAKIINRLGAIGKFLLRLDFNGIATWQTFERFMTSLEVRGRAHIEYVEDPFPFDEDSWQEARKLVKIGIDQQIKNYKWSDDKQPPFDVVVLKPTRQDVDETVNWAIKWKRRITVTTNMDHPVGNMHAYSIAQELAEKYTTIMNEPGCLTIDAYERNLYAAAMEVRGPYISRVPSKGIGFDGLLKREQWIPLTGR